MKPFRLAARETKNEDTIVQIMGPGQPIMIGEGYCTIIAGPCAVENREDYLGLAQFLAGSGAHILRGGLFKPRTSPYSFRGLGKEGLEIMKEARAVTGLPIITEVMDARDLDYLVGEVDVLQVGSRNMQNYTLLDQLGQINTPVLLKRGFSATIEEWLLAAEYILVQGNNQVILCERGIRTFEPYTRNTVDIGAVALIKRLSHLPVLVDPSHATGKWDMVIPVAKAAIAAGADGVMVEVHQEPERALSDGKQSLNKDNFLKMIEQIKRLADLENKKVQTR
ncbi:MAG: 3-deoxy-7-phosphoheptulonate synthase [Syntrophomonadaceae bacterium]|nr:3-deoxy-7-phosphoheptulonate synthase [Bacillota bacterium]NLM88147.1 3-deoxy-7-phosphoheptulonate synthase [Syntrophomonadaceae bacterium]HQA50833.1 3-deoxy-7-phosphoheptulonate synthase [Syntrophomonadaceae bacterium]HQD91292.1 3-deoxy-7-phosphoheptulonate synthase [Syntrophomonadaceae bacterium]